uniref:CSON007521 protein n=1 Tax=Culicoides sonorensis TaxID=179676 RepID=A0A336LLY4_CULSO
MELDLNKIDYVQVGITGPYALAVLPTPEGDKHKQRVAVASQEGHIVVFSLKKNEVQVHFKTLVGPSISAIHLGGTVNTLPDKVFVASENRVYGFNKKGKQFLAFDTNMTENIKCMFVHGTDLLVCGNHVFNHYKDCVDSGSYLCGDTIVDVAAIYLPNTSRMVVALACSGRVIRLLEYSRLRSSLELTSVPTTLHVPNKSPDRLFCGFADGQVVVFHINPILIDIKRETVVEINENRSAISCIDTFDVTGDGKVELLVGKRDGTVQIYSLPDDNDMDLGSALIYQGNFGESISSVKGGCVRQNGYTEIVVVSYTGLVFGLTTQCISQSFSDVKTMNLEGNNNVSTQDDEFEELNKRLLLERERQRSSSILSSQLNSLPNIHVNDSLILNKEEGSYDLSIEIPMIIDSIMFQCDCPIEFLSKENIEILEPNVIEGTHFMANYHAKVPKTRNDFKFRTVEGQYGTLQAFVTPVNNPGLIEARRYDIKPLSLHIRIHRDLDNLRPFNTLTLKGNFSQAEMHSWLNNCIPEMPERMSQGENVPLLFKHVFVTTILNCEFNKGVAEFKSDNLSTISILKEYLTKEATKKRIKLEISQNINDLSIPHIIKILEPQLIDHVVLREDHKLLQALLELDLTTQEEFDILSPEYQNILNNKETILELYRKDPPNINRLYGFLTDLYIDRFKFKGINVKTKIPILIKLLEEYQYDTIIEFFLGGTKSNENSMENS